MIKIHAYYSNNPQDEVSSFVRGLSHDNDVQVSIYKLKKDKYTPCDILVTHGTYKKYSLPRRNIKLLLQQHKKRTKHGLHIVVEGGFIKKGEYWMVGLNGLNGRANFYNNNSPPDRWNKLKIDLKHWRTSGNHILVIGQVVIDANVQHMDFTRWCDNTFKEIRKYSSKPIVYRLHPKLLTIINVDKLPIKIWKKKAFKEIQNLIMTHIDDINNLITQYDNITISQHNPLQKEKNTLQNRTIWHNEQINGLNKDLYNCWHVITFNSNVGVDAILNGIPVISQDKGSMVYNITSHNIESIRSPQIINNKDRQQWANNIAYAQWTSDELKQGLAWKHLKPHIKNIVLK